MQGGGEQIACSNECAYVQRGSEHGPDLQVEKSRLCKGMGGDGAENTVHGPDLQVEKRGSHMQE